MSKAPSVPELAAAAYGLKLRANRQVRRCWRLETEGGVYALKRAPAPEEAVFLHKAEAHLDANGFHRFPRRVPTAAGEQECFLHNGDRYVLRVWLPGFPPHLDMDHPRDLQRLAVTAAEMHLASLGFLDRDGPRWARGSWTEAAAVKMADLRLFAEAAGTRGRCGRLYLRSIPGAMEEGTTAIELAISAGYQTRSEEAAAAGGFCHGDLAPNNVLMHGGEAFLLDLDRAVQEDFPLDLAMSIQRIASAQGWRPEPVMLFLEAYQRIRTITQRETRILVAMLHWPQAFWRLGHRYFVERLDRPERFFLDRLWHWSHETESRHAFLQCMRDYLW